jgi:transcription initiation factor TFIIB
MKNSDEIRRAFCLDCGYIFNAKDDSRLVGNEAPRGAGTVAVSPRLERDTSAQQGNVSRSELGVISRCACAEWLKKARVSDQTEKNIAQAFSETTRIAIQLTLSKVVVQRAADLWKTALEKRLSRGRSLRALSAAIVYTACRQCSAGITLNEIAEVSETDTRIVGRYCSILARELKQAIPLPRLEDYASRILNELHADERLTWTVKRILSITQGVGIACGKDPRGISSAAIYLASILLGQRRTQREISQVGGVTEMTIRKNCRALEKQLRFLCAC